MTLAVADALAACYSLIYPDYQIEICKPPTKKSNLPTANPPGLDSIPIVKTTIQRPLERKGSHATMPGVKSPFRRKISLNISGLLVIQYP